MISGFFYVNKFPKLFIFKNYFSIQSKIYTVRNQNIAFRNKKMQLTKKYVIYFFEFIFFVNLIRKN